MATTPQPQVTPLLTSVKESHSIILGSTTSLYSQEKWKKKLMTSHKPKNTSYANPLEQTTYKIWKTYSSNTNNKSIIIQLSEK